MFKKRFIFSLLVMSQVYAVDTTSIKKYIPKFEFTGKDDVSNPSFIKDNEFHVHITKEFENKKEVKIIVKYNFGFAGAGDANKPLPPFPKNGKVTFIKPSILATVTLADGTNFTFNNIEPLLGNLTKNAPDLKKMMDKLTHLDSDGVFFFKAWLLIMDAKNASSNNAQMKNEVEKRMPSFMILFNRYLLAKKVDPATLIQGFIGKIPGFNDVINAIKIPDIPSGNPVGLDTFMQHRINDFSEIMNYQFQSDWEQEALKLKGYNLFKRVLAISWRMNNELNTGMDYMLGKGGKSMADVRKDIKTEYGDDAYKEAVAAYSALKKATDDKDAKRQMAAKLKIKKVAAKYVDFLPKKDGTKETIAAFLFRFFETELSSKVPEYQQLKSAAGRVLSAVGIKDFNELLEVGKVVGNRKKIQAFFNLVSNYKSIFKEATVRYDADKVVIKTNEGDAIIWDFGYPGAGNVSKGFSGFDIRFHVNNVEDPGSWDAKIKTGLTNLAQLANLNLGPFISYTPAQEGAIKLALLYKDRARKLMNNKEFMLQQNMIFIRLIKSGVMNINDVFNGIPPLKSLLKDINLKKLDGYYKKFQGMLNRHFTKKVEGSGLINDPDYKRLPNSLSVDQAKWILMSLELKTLIFYSQLKASFKNNDGKNAAAVMNNALNAAKTIKYKDRIKAKAQARSNYEKAFMDSKGFKDLKDFVKREHARIFWRNKDLQATILKTWDDVGMEAIIGLTSNDLKSVLDEEPPKEPEAPVEEVEAFDKDLSGLDIGDDLGDLEDIDYDDDSEVEEEDF